MKRLILLVPVLMLCASCDSVLSIWYKYFPKDWPSDSLIQIQNAYGVKEDCMFINEITGSKQIVEQYSRDLLYALKQAYPNYADFEKADVYELQPIRVATIVNSTKNNEKIINGNWTNAIWELLEKNSPDVQDVKNNYPSAYMNLKEGTINDISQNFHSWYDFITKVTDNRVDAILREICLTNMENANKEIENIIIRQAEQAEYLSSLSSLLAYKNWCLRNGFYSSNIGEIEFKNKTSSTIYIHLAYYFWGSVWEGWITQGYSLRPGERRSSCVPLNERGFLNPQIFYCARSINDSNYAWSGNYSFITIDTGEDYILPCATDSELLTICKDLRYLVRNPNFKSRDIGDERTKYTLNFTE